MHKCSLLEWQLVVALVCFSYILFPKRARMICRQQGSCINSDSVSAISADSVQRMKNADAALQHSAATALTPCSRPMSLNRSPRIIQKEILTMSDRISYINIVKLQCKSQNWHHNKNWRKGVIKTVKYAINQLPELLLRGTHSPLTGTCFTAA